MKASSKNLWAPIIKPRRGREWIMNCCMRYTKAQAVHAYLDDRPKEQHAEALSYVRFARVTITEQ